MIYLIIPKETNPFLTEWYEYENNYTKGMVIIDFHSLTYSKDGINFYSIETDHL